MLCCHTESPIPGAWTLEQWAAEGRLHGTSEPSLEPVTSLSSSKEAWDVGQGIQQNNQELSACTQWHLSLGANTGVADSKGASLSCYKSA